MAPADAEHRFAFRPFDISVNSLAVFVTHLSAEVCCRVDRWLLTEWETHTVPRLHHHPSPCSNPLLYIDAFGFTGVSQRESWPNPGRNPLPLCYLQSPGRRHGEALQLGDA